jgi:hypothetical protein
MTYGDPSLLILAIRPSKNDRPIKDLDRFLEIDAMFDEI